MQGAVRRRSRPGVAAVPRLPRLPLLAAAGLLALGAAAQTLPPPSRTVWRCDAGGRTVYSDVPCPGAAKVDVEPTRGMNRLGGNERIGRDVQRERVDEAYAEVLRPLTGLDARQREVRARRMRLAPEAQRGCADLDRDLPRAEAAAKAAAAPERPAAAQSLYELRARFHRLGC